MANYKELSNAQLRRKIDEIKNEYDSTKDKIEELCSHMEALEKEYAGVMQELDSRKSLN